MNSEHAITFSDGSLVEEYTVVPFIAKNKKVVACTVCLGHAGFSERSAKALFNFMSVHVDKKIESAFAFYHETSHALDLKCDKFMPLSLEGRFNGECTADSYAALRLIQDYGLIKAISFLKFISDFRILNHDDLEHLTTFTLDLTIKKAIELEKNGVLKNMTPKEIKKCADDLVLQDPLLKGGVFNFYLPNGLGEKIISPDYDGRFSQAVHRNIDITSHLDREATSIEQISNGPWAKASAKFKHASSAEARDVSNLFSVMEVSREISKAIYLYIFFFKQKERFPRCHIITNYVYKKCMRALNAGRNEDMLQYLDGIRQTKGVSWMNANVSNVIRSSAFFVQGNRSLGIANKLKLDI